LELLRGDEAIALTVGAPGKDLVFEIEQGARRLPGVVRINKDCPLAEELTVPLQDEISRGVQ